MSGREAVARNTAGEAREWLLDVVLLVAAAALWGGHLRHLVPVAVPIAVPWGLVAAALVVAELKIVTLETRRQAYSFTLSDLPMIVGFAFVPPGQLALAVLVGSAGTVLADRGQSTLTKASNFSSMLYYNLFAIAVYRVVLGGSTPVSPRGWVATVAGSVAVLAVSSAIVSLGISLHEGRPGWHMSPAMTVASVATFTADTVLGLVVVIVAWYDVQAVWLPLIAVAILLTALWGMGRAWRRNRQLELLYEFMAQRTGGTDELLVALLRRVRAMMTARVAQVVLLHGHEGDGPLVLTVGPDGEPLSTRPGTAALAASVVGVAARTGSPVLVTRSGGDESVRAVLRAEGHRDAVAVPLHGDRGVIGALLAADRSASLSGFNAGDARLLEAVATHAASIVENSMLIELLRRQAALSEHEATHDPLTGLANRTLFRRRLDEALEAGGSAKVGVLLVDLDRFKQVNDREGHHIGDLLLAELAGRLRDCLPTGATAARLGGDEFAAVVPCAQTAEAVQLADRMLAALRRPVTLDGRHLRPEGSIGVAVAPDHATTASALLRRADQAMYAAKAGRVGSVLFSTRVEPTPLASSMPA